MSTTIPKAIICDLDGTLCDHLHRLHFVDLQSYVGKDKFDHNAVDWSWKADWDAFYAAMDKDGVNQWCKEIIFRFGKSCFSKHEECNILFVTGRPEKYRKSTQDWLAYNYAFDDGYKLFMRPDYLPDVGHKMADYEKREIVPLLFRDHRPSHIVKQEIYVQNIQNVYDVLFVLEDDPKCVSMYRNFGLTVLDVGEK